MGKCDQTNSSPVIVLAAFGSSTETGLSNLNDLDKMIQARFPNHDVRWAFTSGLIVKKLRAAGVQVVFDRKAPVKSLDDVYQDLRAEARLHVVVQCILAMAGAEMQQVFACDATGLNVVFGYPLLFGTEGVQNTINALAAEFGRDETATILCAHGNAKHPEYNAALARMDAYVRANYDKVYVATIEGPPGIEAVAAEVKASGASAVRFVPLMLTDGDHMQNDVMGDEPSSWKTLLGLPATSATGMASNPRVADLFMESIAHLIPQS